MIRNGLLIGPPGREDALAKVRELLVRDPDREGANGCVGTRLSWRRRELGHCGLLSAHLCLGLYRLLSPYESRHHQAHRRRDEWERARACLPGPPNLG